MRRISSVLALLIGCAGCLVGGTIRPTLEHPTAEDVGRLWVEPIDLESRDLYFGVGGASLAPVSGTSFEFMEVDDRGYSRGYDVRGPDGLEWSVKLGPEAQTEVVVSRILWALGYHQPPTYYLSEWTLTGGEEGGPQPAGRFRPELPGWDVVDDWSWYENDFINTRPFKGLLVVNVLLNNWDWKTSNNKVYEIARPDGGVGRRYVVRDVGASLGKTSYPQWLAWFPTRGLGQGSRNDLEDFESKGFIEEVEGDRVEFVYDGIHGTLVDTIVRDDVVWAARLMGRLSEAQWRDAFRAAGYDDEATHRYVAKIREKIAEGLKLVG